MADVSATSSEKINRKARRSDGDTMTLNMGPQHPSTHGVLRLLDIFTAASKRWRKTNGISLSFLGWTGLITWNPI